MGSGKSAVCRLLGVRAPQPTFHEAYDLMLASLGGVARKALGRDDTVMADEAARRRVCEAWAAKKEQLRFTMPYGVFAWMD